MLSETDLSEDLLWEWTHSLDMRRDWRDYERSNARARLAYQRLAATIDRRYQAA